MPDPIVYTRPGGSQTTDPTFLDRIFNGPQQINAVGHTALSTLPYVGGIYNFGRGINALVHYLGSLGNTGTGGSGDYSSPPTDYGSAYTPPGQTVVDQSPTTPNTNNPPMYAGGVTGTAPTGPALLSNQPNYNMGQILNLWSQRFPGSAIGQFAPGGSYASNPRAQAGLGIPNIVDPSMTAYGALQTADMLRGKQL